MKKSNIYFIEKIKISIITLFLLWGYSIVHAQTSLEMFSKATTPTNPTGNGPVQSTKIYLQDNTNNPAGNAVAAANNPVDVTYTLSNHAYAFTTGNPLGTGFMTNIGAATSGADLIYPLTNSIAAPLNSYYTAGTTTGQGIDVAVNRNVNFHIYIQPLVNNSVNPTSRIKVCNVTLTFSRPVDNPILHITGMGAYSQSTSGVTSSYSAEFNVLGGYTLTRLSGNSINGFVVENTSQISNNNSTFATSGANSGSGSVRVNGTDISTLILEVYIDGANSNTVWNPFGTSNAGETVTIGVSLPQNVLVANNDTFSGGTEGTSATTASVLVNDTFNGGTATTTNVTVSGTTVPAGFTVNADGTITKAASVTAGTYTINYQICDNAEAGNCKTATMAVTVLADADGDGVTDSIDLDDDNDGILDTVENSSCSVSSPVVYGNNLVTNGSFESGNTGFTSAFTYGTCNTVCGDSWEAIFGNYYIVTSACNCSGSSSGISAWQALPHSGNNLMLIDFPTSGTSNIYVQTINVKPNTKYNFSAWITNLVYPLFASSDPSLQLSIQENSGPLVAIGTGAPVPEGGGWLETAYNFTTGSSTSTVTLYIQNGNSGGSGNDAGIDDITLREVFCDTDGDGIPNYLDLDSDGDGCPDAVEGGDNITQAMLNASNAIATNVSGVINGNNIATVDANGVPVITNTGSTYNVDGQAQGQTVGQSTTVNPAAVAGTTSANQSICNGTVPAAITLTGSTGAIQWQSSTDNVTFTNISGATSASYSPAALTATTYYRAVLTSVGGCTVTSNVITITVNALPTITGTTSVCAGSTTQLTGSASPAASNPWTSSNTAVATVSSTGLVTGVAAGSATITYTNSNGCSTTATITVNALPTITGTTSVCAGSTTQLTGSASPAASNPWTSSNTAVATISSTGLVTGVAAGSATITYTNSNGCIKTATITVNALPTITGTTSVCAGSTTQLTGSASPAASNPWTSSNTAVATVSSTGLVTGVAAGSATITYTNSNGCSITITVTVNNCIDAVNDTYASVTPGTTTASVIVNDINNAGTAAVIGSAAGQVSIRTSTDASGNTGSWPSGITLNPDGTIAVANGTAAGTYTLYYTICNQTAGTTCDTATVTLTVPPTIDAINGSQTVNSGSTGTSVISNDTIQNGVAGSVTLGASGNATISQVSTTNAGVNIDANGNVVVNPGTPAGTYTIAYQICTKALPVTCDTATEIVTVTTPFCYKTAATGGTVLDTNHGITVLGRAGADNGNWPMVRKGAWTALEAKSKGFVINRIPTTAQVNAIANPVEGMMVYDEEADCLKIYTKDNDPATSYSWRCFNNQTCPDVL